MRSSHFCHRLAAFTILCCPSLLLAQASDRPQDAPPPTREEIARRLAEEPMRKALALYGLGGIMAHEDRLIEAKRNFEEVIRLDPKALAPKRSLAQIYLLLERTDELMELCREIVAVDPGDFEIWATLAAKQKQAGQLTEASESFRRAVASKRLDNHPGQRLNLLGERAKILEQQFASSELETVLRQATQILAQHTARLAEEGRKTESEILEVLANTHVGIGQICVTNKRFPEAIVAFRDAQAVYRKITPKSAMGGDSASVTRLDGHLSEVYLAQEQWELALESLNRYLESAPPSTEGYERKVKVLKRLGRGSEVIPALRRYADADANHLGLRLLLAHELAIQPNRQGEREAETIYIQLERSYTHAQVIRGLFTLYQRQQRMEMVLLKLDEVWKIIEAKESAEDVKAQAVDRAKMIVEVLKSDRELVQALLQAAMRDLNRRTPRAFNTWRTLATLASRGRILDTAEAMYRQALRQANPPFEAEIADGLVAVLWSAHKHAEIVEVCREMLADRDGVNQVLFRFNLALALANLDQYDEAVREIDQAIKLSSDGGRLSARIRKVGILRRAQRFEQAVAECKAMLEESTNPGQTREIRSALSYTYGAMKQTAKAEEELRKILELDPNDATANNDLGYQMAEQGRNLDEAERMIRKAIDLDRSQRKLSATAEAENAAFLDSLGWVLFRQGKLDEAKRWLEQAAAMAEGDDDPTVWDHLGDVRAKLNLPTPAREAWQKALVRFERDRRTYPADRLEEVKRKLRQLEPRTIPATPVKRGD